MKRKYFILFSNMLNGKYNFISESTKDMFRVICEAEVMDELYFSYLINSILKDIEEHQNTSKFLTASKSFQNRKKQYFNTVISFLNQ